MFYFDHTTIKNILRDMTEHNGVVLLERDGKENTNLQYICGKETKDN